MAATAAAPIIRKNVLLWGSMPKAAPGFNTYVIWKIFSRTGILSPSVILDTIVILANLSSRITRNDNQIKIITSPGKIFCHAPEKQIAESVSPGQTPAQLL
jgi:hypothetical protein